MNFASHIFVSIFAGASMYVCASITFA